MLNQPELPANYSSFYHINPQRTSRRAIGKKQSKELLRTRVTCKACKGAQGSRKAVLTVLSIKVSLSLNHLKTRGIGGFLRTLAIGVDLRLAAVASLNIMKCYKERRGRSEANMKEDDAGSSQTRPC